MTIKDGDFIQITEEDLPPITIDNSELPPLPQQETLLTFLRRLFTDVRQTASERPIERANLIENVERVLSVDDIQWSETETPYSVEELFGQEDESVGADELDINILTEEENSFALRLAVSAQNNRDTAKWFFKRLRQVGKSIMPTVQNDVANETQYFGGTELGDIAGKWGIPLAIYQQGRHWFLMLKPPEQHTTGWRFLAYNPYEDSELWVDMPNFPGVVTTNSLQENMIYTNTFGLNALVNGQYDLSLPVDDEIANNYDLIAAKRAGLQPRIDAQNCGPACLLMAAIRSGIQIEPNGFQLAGRDEMKTDLSTPDQQFEILTREEILQQLEPPDTSGVKIE